MPNFFLAADLGLFFGRLHPLIVHLPIGFLLLAAVLEWWPGEKARPAIQTAWFLGRRLGGCRSGGGVVIGHRKRRRRYAVLAPVVGRKRGGAGRRGGIH